MKSIEAQRREQNKTNVKVQNEDFDISQNYYFQGFPKLDSRETSKSTDFH